MCSEFTAKNLPRQPNGSDGAPLGRWWRAYFGAGSQGFWISVPKGAKSTTFESAFPVLALRSSETKFVSRRYTSGKIDRADETVRRAGRLELYVFGPRHGQTVDDTFLRVGEPLAVLDGRQNV